MNNILAVLVVLSLGGAVFAQDTPTPGGGQDHPKKGRRAELLKRFDKNGDGKLDEQERAAAKEAMKAHRQEHRAAVIKKFDTDGDGKLNDAEKAAAKAAHKQHREGKRAAIIKKFDANGDGKLDDAEKAAAKKACKEHHQKQGGKRHKKDGQPPK